MNLDVGIGLGLGPPTPHALADQAVGTDALTLRAAVAPVSDRAMGADTLTVARFDTPAARLIAQITSHPCARCGCDLDVVETAFDTVPAVDLISVHCADCGITWRRQLPH